MAFEQRIDKLVTKLTELTESGRMEWSETGDQQTFLTPAGKHRVAIRMVGSEPAATYSLKIYNELGTLLEEASGSEPEEQNQPLASTLINMMSPPLPPQDRLRNLYQLARRSALSVDKSLSELLESLEQIR